MASSCAHMPKQWYIANHAIVEGRNSLLDNYLANILCRTMSSKIKKYSAGQCLAANL